MLPDIHDYDALTRAFRWNLPATYNMATDACDQWARRAPDRPALFVPEAGGLRAVSYGALCALSNRLAHALAAHGIRRGDRVAILLPQSVEVLATHFAVYKLGAIAVPLAGAFGVDAIAYRLTDSGARALVTDDAGLAKITPRPETLELVVNVDGARAGGCWIPRGGGRAPPTLRPPSPPVPKLRR